MNSWLKLRDPYITISKRSIFQAASFYTVSMSDLTELNKLYAQAVTIASSFSHHIKTVKWQGQTDSFQTINYVIFGNMCMFD